MTEAEAAAYLEGSQVAWTMTLRECLKHLDIGGNLEARYAALAAERRATIAALRGVCEEYGDNDWSDDLHLADVVEKHLHRNLRADQ